MNAFDRALLGTVNHFAHRSPVLDAAVGALAGLDLLKGGLFMAILTWYWFAGGPQRSQRREVVLATLVAGAIAVLVGRALANLLPFRLRPLYDADVPLVVPYFAGNDLSGWSSFPSDHAMLFGALATGLFFIRRRLGILANVYALAVIDLPRVYLGWHYPTDILAGLALGVAFGVVGNLEPVRDRFLRGPLRWAETHPSAFYALGCVVLIQVGTMFSDLRTVIHSGSNVGKIAWCTVWRRSGCAAPDAEAVRSSRLPDPVAPAQVPPRVRRDSEASGTAAGP